MLPSFNKSGTLPSGDHILKLSQLRAFFLVAGNADCVAGWNIQWREQLVSQLELLVSALWQVGIERVWVDGSFVENVARPNDIDGYFEVEPNRYHMGHLEQDLRTLGNPSPDVWDWSVASLRPDENGKGNRLCGTNTASNFIPIIPAFHRAYWISMVGRLS